MQGPGRLRDNHPAGDPQQAPGIGNRTLIDLDAAREILITDYTPATITEVSEATGLTVTAIRRGIREGWIPCEKPGRAYQFHLDAVIAAIENRMRDH